MKQAVAQKLLTEQEIDRALLPLMMTRLKLGILEYDAECPYNEVKETEICSPAHIALARKAATESMVLLKNNGILPLDKNLHTVFVAGPGASDSFWLMGNYFGISNRYCTYLQGIADKLICGSSVKFCPAFGYSTPT